MDGMVRTGGLPEKMVPLWQGDIPVSTHGVGSKGKKRASATEEDVEMLEPGQHEMSKPAKTKRKVETLVFPIEVPVRRSRSQSGTSEGNPGARGKRTRPATPEKEEGRSKKRPKVKRAVPPHRTPRIATSSKQTTVSVGKVPKKVGMVSLGEYEFNEFDEVTEDLVPGIVGKVSRVWDLDDVIGGR